jgi:hypothetical protein
MWLLKLERKRWVRVGGMEEGREGLERIRWVTEGGVKTGDAVHSCRTCFGHRVEMLLFSGILQIEKKEL